MIAVNNSGTERLVFDANTGQPKRVSTGDSGFGVRVDEMWYLVDVIEAASGSRVGPAGRFLTTTSCGTGDLYCAHEEGHQETTPVTES